MAQLDRRRFLLLGGGATGTAVVASTYLETLTRASRAMAAPAPTRIRSAAAPLAAPYGPLSPVPDQNGDEILALPPGFTYVTFSRTGDTMSDGTPVPRNHDGMGAFVGPRGRIRLIRNHEVRNGPGDNTLAVLGPRETRYDAVGVGGTTTLDYDQRGRQLVRDFVSLNGTIVNCAGGVLARSAGLDQL